MPSLSFSHNRLACCTGNYRRPPYTRGTITCLACCSTPNSATVLRQRLRLPVFWHSRLTCCIRSRPQLCASCCCHRFQHTFCIFVSMSLASAARQTTLLSESVYSLLAIPKRFGTSLFVCSELSPTGYSKAGLTHSRYCNWLSPIGYSKAV